MIARLLIVSALTVLIIAADNPTVPAQDKIKVVYSSADATNFVWYAAQDAGFYKKHGLEVELIFVPSSTTAVSSMIAGDIQIGNNSGGTVASAVVSGANLVLTGCYINTLPYELVVHESIKSADELRGKSIGISRVGSASGRASCRNRPACIARMGRTSACTCRTWRRTHREDERDPANHVLR